MASYYVTGYSTPQGVSSRADVREWQNRLGVKADGIWGPKTQAAYEQYNAANSLNTFQNYYNTIMGALSVPSISVNVPSKEALKADISSYLRPSVDLAISNRRARGETNKAELDADAVSRGMGASTYVTSMKGREDGKVESDISMMEAQYTATLAERIASALEKYEAMSMQAQMQNAQYAYNAQSTALGLASQWFNSYMNNAAKNVKRSGGTSSKGGLGLASKNMSTKDYIRFVGGLSGSERSMLYNSGSTEWALMRLELQDALGKDGYNEVRSAFPVAPLRTTGIGASKSTHRWSGSWATIRR